MQATVIYTMNMYNNTNLAHGNMTHLVLKQAASMPLLIGITILSLLSRLS